jgi:hypothetical protein
MSLNIKPDNWKDKIPQVIMGYRTLEASASTGGPYMIAEIRNQYADMANGGGGGEIHREGSEYHHTIRDQYYPGLPDQYFREVCDLMAWPR